jgi:hypothetical protein
LAVAAAGTVSMFLEVDVRRESLEVWRGKRRQAAGARFQLGIQKAMMTLSSKLTASVLFSFGGFPQA